MSQSTDNWSEVRDESEQVLPPEIVEAIEQVRGGEHSDSQLISILHKVQGHFGHLGREQLDAVAQLMQIPAAKVTGVATFYHFFRLTPRGQFMINLCMGTACYVQGADRVAEKLQDELGIEFGETTSDGLFSLEQSRCLGTCGLAPVMTVNDDVYGNVTPDKIPALLEKYAKLGREQS